MKKLICITPIKHIDGLYEFFNKNFTFFYKPNISKINLKSLLLRSDIQIIFCNPNKQKFLLDKDILMSTSIKIINTASTGTDHIDINYCKLKGIKILSLKKDLQLIKQLPSTAELAFGIMLNLMRNISISSKSVSKGEWDYEKFIGYQLKGKKIGIIGYGRLGKLMASYCNSFGMEVFIYDKYIKSRKYKNISLKKIYQTCEIISIHVHLNAETKYMISNFKELKKRPFIINTSRGAIVDENELVKAIKKDLIKGYGCDVLENEILGIKNNLVYKLSKKNSKILITPHIGGMTFEGQQKAYFYAANKLIT